MKVNLLLNNDKVLQGYLNIDPYSNGDERRQAGELTNLDDLVEDAECDELIADNVIDYIHPKYINDALNNWISKLRHGGEIVLSGIDIREVAYALLEQKISLTDANVLLYGTQVLPCDYRKATLTMQQVINQLEEIGLKVLQKRILDFKYYIRAKRP